MKPLALLCILLFACTPTGNTDVEVAQPVAEAAQSYGIDSVIASDTAKPFNGVILISQNGKTLFAKAYGFADIDRQIPLALDDKFVIGSLSKQLTAAIALREYENGRVDIHAPIGRYLSHLTQPWKDSVTLHHLLSHTHGIRGLNSGLSFSPGTQFAYSNFGYGLVEKVLESATGRTFADLATTFFRSCGMHQTSYPDRVFAIQSYSEHAEDSILPVRHGKHFAVAAGGFVSTAQDLAHWTHCLHSGKVLADSSYRMMIGKYAVRRHKVFGDADYGYGISAVNSDSIRYIGHSGYALGFASIDYYFPETKTSLVVLENIAYGPSLHEVYAHHLKLLNAMAAYLIRRAS